MNEVEVFDVAVIGAGTAGLNAYREAKKTGKTVMLVDPGPLGTTCARVGCMPSKLLIAAAEKAHAIQEGAALGVHVSGFSVDSKQALSRVRKLRDFFTSFGVESVREIEKTGEFIQDKAQFVGRSIFMAGGRTIKASSVVLAIGAKAVIPEDYKNLKNCLLTYENIFEQEVLPKKVLVVGTGVIGLELGQALHFLGVDVTFISRRKKFGPIVNPELIEDTYSIFSKEVRILCGYKIESLEENNAVASVKFKDLEGKMIEEEFDKVLVASGTKPNYESLDLEKTGITVKDGVCQLDFDRETLQIGNSSFFLAGDATHEKAILHEAAIEGQVAGRNAANFPKLEKIERNVSFSIVFTHPQIAMVGKNYSEIKDNPKYISTYIDYATQGRARVMNENKGRVYLYADKETQSFVGAEMVCPRAENMAHLLAWSIEMKMTVPQMLKMPFYHPVFEEGLRTALRDLNKQLNQ